MTPTTATARTVISTIVSSPRKSVRMTVTTSPPWASGVRAMWAAEAASPSGGRDNAVQITANALSPATIPATALR